MSKSEKEILKEWAKELKVPAVAAFVTVKDSVFFFTLGEDAQGNEVTTRTLFEGASLSKPIFAAMVSRQCSNRDSVFTTPNMPSIFTSVKPATNESFSELYGLETTLNQVLSHTIGDTFHYRETGYLALQALWFGPPDEPNLKKHNAGFIWKGLDTTSFVNGYIVMGDFERQIRRPIHAYCNGTFTTGIAGLEAAYKNAVEPFLDTWLRNKHFVQQNTYWAPGIAYELASDTFAWHYGSNYCFNSFWIKNLSDGKTAGILTNSGSGKRLIARWIPHIMETNLTSFEVIEWYR